MTTMRVFMVTMICKWIEERWLVGVHVVRIVELKIVMVAERTSIAHIRSCRMRSLIVLLVD